MFFPAHQFSQSQREWKADLASFASAVRSGDMLSAKQAFGALETDLSTGGPSGGTAPGSLLGVLGSLSSALQAGDTSAAEKVIAVVQSVAPPHAIAPAASTVEEKSQAQHPGAIFDARA